MIVAVVGVGFIGSQLCKRLKRDGHEVHALDIKDNTIDITDRTRTVEIIERINPDIIFCTAAIIRSEDCRLQPIDAFNTNTTGVINILDAATRCGAKVMFSSTVHVYGNYEDNLIDEHSTIDINQPMHIYPYTKIAAEGLIRSYSTMYGLKYNILRYGVVVGPQGHDDMVVHRFLRHHHFKKPINVYGSIETRRCFVYIDDLINANMLIIKSDIINKTYNVCMNETYSLNDIITSCREITGNICDVHIVEKRCRDFSSPTICNDVIKHETGWEQTVDLKQAMNNYYKWMIKT